MKCRKCKNTLKILMTGTFDPFSFLEPTKQMYCENSNCQEFGYVVVVGIPEDKPLTDKE